jgi:hypothetical protein
MVKCNNLLMKCFYRIVGYVYRSLSIGVDNNGVQYTHVYTLRYNCRLRNIVVYAVSICNTIILSLSVDDVSSTLNDNSRKYTINV